MMNSLSVVSFDIGSGVFLSSLEGGQRRVTK